MRIHRGWIILILTVLNLLACLGFGRFSLGAIIPFMKEGLTLSYSEAGFIASAVFFGYLLSVVMIGHLVERFSPKKVIIASLIVTTLGMFFSSQAFNFWSAYAACLIIGLGSGGANVPSLGLVRHWFSQRYRGTALGITNAGSGFGMVVSGFIVPYLMVLYPDDGWRVSWLVLAIAACVIIVLNFFLLVEDPKELGLEPVGGADEPIEVAATIEAPKKATTYIENVYKSPIIWAFGLIYFSWGFSYLIYSTFFVDFLISVNIDQAKAGFYFASGGIASIFSGFIWGSLSDRIGRERTLFLIFLIQSLLLFSFAFSTNAVVLFVELILYALTLWGVPTVIVAAVSDKTAIHKTAVGIGFITLFFGIGQWISPMISGFLIDWSHSYKIAYILSAVVALLGSIGCLHANRMAKKLVE